MIKAKPKSKKRAPKRQFEIRYWWIKAVCSNPNHPDYASYGGRGIEMYWNRYNEFENYILTHLGLPRKDQLFLSRIDVNGNYEPGNIRWSTGEEKSNNCHSKNHIIDTPKGLMSVKRAAQTYAINIYTLRYRLRNGWTVNEALELQ